MPSSWSWTSPIASPCSTMARKSPTMCPLPSARTGPCWRPISAMPEELLIARGLQAGYPNKQILFEVDFEVRRGEVVALLGANGSGKSTALNCISGFIRPGAGSIRLDGRELAGKPPHEIFRLGIAQVSQTRDLFPQMSVEENLRLGAARRPELEAGRQLATGLEDFPRFAERPRQT